ncbi:MAG TPA: gamma-glutamyl-gamma-aminobutyrate hydrolase family protein [Pyrinomonadaceae bacterium]
MRLELETRRFYLGRDYSEAVEGCGGLPVHIPLIADAEFLEQVVSGLDGILLPGCDTDVDPSHYGEDPHPKLKRVVPEKDAADMLVLEIAERLNLPVLAICYGMQVLNVARGGSLIQDIESEVENFIQHQQGVPLERNSHSITISAGNPLYDLAGKSNEQVKVNSHHHQAIRRAGRNLEAIAWANDGVVEGIVDTRPERFVLGVQWHPELSWTFDAFSRRIFEAFVGRCSDGIRRSSTKVNERDIFEADEGDMVDKGARVLL